jgi:Uma2 family endonuclease
MSIHTPIDPLPTTSILQLFPSQGEWQDGDYFSLPGNRLVEMVDGFVEVLPMPSLQHQFLARLIFLKLHEASELRKAGIVMTAPTRVQIGSRHYREPDVLFVAERNLNRRQAQYWETADIVVEIVSPDDPDRDLVDKRRDYALAGIPEYWIVDPRDQSVRVLSISDGEYREVDQRPIVESRVLPGMKLNVAELFQRASELT